jgi:hypothetical protein
MIINRSINPKSKVLEPPEIQNNTSSPNDEPDEPSAWGEALGIEY